MLDDELGAEIERSFGFRVVGLARLVNGVNVSYRVAFPDRHGLYKIHALDRTIDDLVFEHEALAHIVATNAASVARPLPCRTGGSIGRLIFEGKPRLVSLYEWAPGEPPGVDAHALGLFGQNLAALHAGAQGFSPSWRKPLSGLVDYWKILQGAANPATNLIDAFCIAALQTAAEGLGIPQDAGQATGFCHGDAWLGNAKIAHEKLVFFDFEACGFGHRGYDLATLGFWLLGAKPFSLFEAFLHGYFGEAGASAQLVRSIGYFIVLNRLRALAYLVRYDLLDTKALSGFSRDTRGLIDRFLALPPGQRGDASRLWPEE